MLHSVLLDHAAELLGMSRRTVYYRIREGRLRTVRTRCGSQRVLMESILELMRDDRGLEAITPDAAASSTAPSGKSPAP
jgi:excisionase family DNA binding protein